MLVNITNDTTNHSYANEIEKHLERIETSFDENLFLAKKLNLLKEQTKETEEECLIKQNRRMILESDINSNNKDILSNEKKQLISSIKGLTEEVEL